MTTRKPAPCVRATASRHVGWRAQGSRRTSGVKAFAYAPHDGGAHGVGLSGMVGDACVSLQAPPPKVATQVSGGRDGPRRIDGDARTKHQVRAWTPRRSHRPEVAPDVAILRQAQNRYVASDALASMTEATRQHRSVSRRTRRSRSSVDTGPLLAGCLPTDRLEDGQPRLHRLEGGATSLRPSWGRP
jgi:hypothetical protein